MSEKDEAIFKIAEAIMERDGKTGFPTESYLHMAASLYRAGVRPKN